MGQETIAVAADHAGFELKNVLAEDLRDRGFEILDLGTDRADSVDYPDYAQALARAIADGRAGRGVLVCGSGLGVSMSANRFRNVRAAPCWNEESARLARAHNDANVLALGARLIDEATARRCLDIFLQTEFEGGRHNRRVGKIDDF